MSLRAGNKYSLEITGLSHEGAGVGRLEGIAVFVTGALPGEQVETVIEKVKKKFAIGRLSKVITPSLHRINPPCSIYRACGGCQFQHLDYKEQLEAKTKRVGDTLERIGKVKDFILKPAIGMLNPWHYRNKAQLHAGWHQGRVRLGYFKPGSWDLVPITTCNLLPEEFSSIVAKLETLIQANNVEPYDRKKKEGYLKHVIMKKSQGLGEFMLVFVTTGGLTVELESIAKTLSKAYPAIASFVHSVNTSDDTHLGSEFTVIHGKNTIQEKLGSLTFSISAPAFFQVNVEQMKVLYDKAVAYADLQGTETVLDLYSGTGTISLFMAGKAKKVHGIEEVAMAVEDARLNAKLNGIANAEFYAGKVESILPDLAEKGIKADIIILDPPRQGCAPQVLEAAAAMEPNRMVYVSCDPATVARDLGLLQELGYKTTEVQPVDMFPWTGHVETVVYLSRKNPDDRIEIDLSLDEFDITTAESKATYEEIKDYVLKNHSMKVSSLYISQVKRKLGLEVGTNYNLPKSEDARVPQCPFNKEKVITEALNHFRMI